MPSPSHLLGTEHVVVDTGDFTTPTWEELSDEQRQGYEVIRRKRKEEFEALKKKCEEEDFQEYIKLFPPSSNHVGPSVMLGQDKKQTSQANQQKKVDSAITIEPANEAGSCNTGAGSNNQRKDNPGITTDSAEAELSSSGNSKSGIHAESIKPTEENFVDEDHGKRPESAVFKFSG